MSIFQAFRKNTRGNVAMMFAFAIIPLVGAAGVAVDYARISRMHTQLADSLDAGLLSIGGRLSMNDQQAYEAVNTWMQDHMPETQKGQWQLDSLTQSNETLTAVASATVDMTLTKVLGVQQVPMSITAQIVRSVDKVEMVMVLDNTGSMRGTKIVKLKEAADNLVDSLAKAATRPEDLRIGLVPFSQTVNVGPRYANASWLDAAGRSATARSLFLGQQVNRFDLFKAMGESWGGCVETLAMPYETQAAAPNPANPNTLYVPYFAPDEPGNKGKGPYNNSYLNDSQPKAVRAALAAQGLPTNAPDFQLLQGDVLKYASGKPYSGTTGTMSYKYGPNSGCEIAPLLRLSSDTAAVRSAIDAMIANGNTDIPVGLTWGRNVLAPDGPFGDGVAYDNTEWTKVAVVMTDGNNENQFGNQEDESYYSGIGYIWQGRIGATKADKATRTKLRDERLAEICAAMKKQGVVIYSVRVEVKNGSSDVLKECASGDDKFYDVQDVSGLVTAFNEIGSSIQKLRIAR